MTTAVAKKPPSRGSDSTESLASSPAVAGNGAPVTRHRSTRSGAPVAARAAAHQRTQSRLNGSFSGAAGASPPSDAEEAARAETIALLDDLKARLSQAEGTSDQFRRQAEVLQIRLDETLKEQARLEEKVHEHEEQIEGMRNSERDAARQIREMETIYEAERSSMMKEKEEMGHREEQMQAVIQRLKDNLSQRAANGDEEARSSRQASNSSPSGDGGSFAPPSSVQRSDSRNNSKLLLQKDKLIESLRLELAEAQIKLVESENQGGGHLQEVERSLMEARMANARLMEDNEGYQLLLQEKTLKGDFGQGDFSYMGSAANQDALDALEGKTGDAGALSSLADELSGAAESENDDYRRLETEIRSLKDQNKALSLYINKIIERLLQHSDFEHILDQSSDFKPSASKDSQQGQGQSQGNSNQSSTASFMQRARSMATGNSNNNNNNASIQPAKPKPRPITSMPPPSNHNSGFSNPDTAPSIPIGLSRGASVRRGRPMSEQFGSGAASVVNQMYKGPDGPLSPSLRNSQTFFMSPGQGKRASSGASAPALSTSGNFPGETSSVSGDSAHTGDVSTPPSHSPPRPQSKFEGNKPRPLRLVQENETTTQNKRGSWMMNMNWGFKKKDEPLSPSIVQAGSDPIHEER